MWNSVTSNDGTEIAWYDFGGDGPDLLLAHATGFCGQIWGPIVEHLPNFRCVAYDVRGHGMSSRPTSPPVEGFNWNRFADDALAVIKASGMEKPFGVGHSSGGATELLIEERLPGTFQSLYLFEPVIFAFDPPVGPMPDRELAIRTRKRRTSFESREEAIANFSERGPFSTLDNSTLAAYVDKGFEELPDGSLRLRCNPDDEAEVYVMATAHDGYPHLPKVECSTTIARGGKSLSFSTEEMQAVVDRLPNSELVEFLDWGHFGPLEHPKVFADVISNAFA